MPGLVGKDQLSEQEISQQVATLCHLPAPHQAFLESAAPVVKQLRRRQFISDFVRLYHDQGVQALRPEDLRRVLVGLAKDLDDQAERVPAAAESESAVPPYNKRFTGRLDELMLLPERLNDDRSGVICGVHGLGGIGKTELAFTNALAFASA